MQLPAEAPQVVLPKRQTGAVRVVAAEVPGTEAVGSADGSGPEIVELIDYDTLTLAQLRARLRSVAVEDLIALVDYEKSHRDRAPFVTMLENRIAAQNKRSTEA